MNVRPSTRRRALLGLFRIRRKRSGGRLTAKELERAWHPTTGLRRADLQLALIDLAEQALLRQRQTAAGLAFELTDDGARVMERGTTLADLNDWITLLRARVRRSRRGWTGPRRSSDVTALAL